MSNVKILDYPNQVSIKRGTLKPVRIKIENVGNKPLKNLELKEGERGDHNSVGVITMDPQKFRVYFSPPGVKRPVYTNRFGVSVGPSLPTGKSAYITFFPQLKDPLRSGTYTLRFKLGYVGWSAPFDDSDEREIAIHVKPALSKLDDLKQALKLTFARPGRVVERFSNKAFDKLQENSLSDYDAIVMAIWKRVDNLPKIIEHIKAQKGAKPILYLWVNNRSAVKKVKKYIEATNLPIKVYVSSWNIGGFGRFYLAKDIAKTHKEVVFIDDDNFIEKDFVNILKKELKPRSMFGRFAHRFNNPTNYWDKETEVEPGEKVDYIGTCGMITHTSIFLDKRLFKCPKRYWFVEDLWLGAFAMKYHGWSLYKSAAKLKTITDGKDQYSRLIDHKNDFLKYLIDKNYIELSKTNRTDRP